MRESAAKRVVRQSSCGFGQSQLQQIGYTKDSLPNNTIIYTDINNINVELQPGLGARANELQRLTALIPYLSLGSTRTSAICARCGRPVDAGDIVASSWRSIAQQIQTYKPKQVKVLASTLFLKPFLKAAESPRLR